MDDDGMRHHWKIRKVGDETRPAGWFRANPNNWRTHPQAQRAALRGSLNELGWIDSVKVNLRTSPAWGDARGTPVMWDGHARIEEALRIGDDVAVPVEYYDFTPAEEALALATLDPIGAMADIDRARFDAVIADVATTDAALLALIRDTAAMPSFDTPHADGTPSGAPSTPAPSLAERFIVPPFSVLDARQGYWQERKRAWLSLGIQSELGRGENALDMSASMAGITDAAARDAWNEARRNSPRHMANDGMQDDPDQLRIDRYRGRPIKRPDARAIKDHQWQAEHLARPQARLTFVAGNRPIEDLDDTSRRIIETTGSGTSIFDPVLCELVYRWFAPPRGAVLDPFAGGSVRGIVAARLGHPYTGVDLRAEQIAANEAQAETILAAAPFAVIAPDDAPTWTPIEAHGDIWLKRDDAYCVAGVRGGKVRTCAALARGAVGLVTAGSRASPQVNIVAHLARRLGIPCRVHTPTGALSPEVRAAMDAGAEVVQHPAGYNNVIIARARDDAAERGWTLIPFGMECQEAITQTRGQVVGLPDGVRRIVVPVGSGMSLAGILWGMADAGLSVPVVGVVVGAKPDKRLDTWAPADWRERVTLVASGTDYHAPADAHALHGVTLDPHYEAKCVPFLEAGDLLWVVGIRQTEADDAPLVPQNGADAAQVVRWRMSAAWASKQVDCTPDGIRDACHGRCCYGDSFWPPRASSRPDGACVHLGPIGCTLSPDDKPVTCHLFPMKINAHNKLLLYNRVAQPGSCCHPNYGHGPMTVEAIHPSLVHLFGQSTADYIVAEVAAGRDPEWTVPASVIAALAQEEAWAETNTIPLPRSQVAMAPARAPVDVAPPRWLVGDSREVSTIAAGTYDLIFSCPPYGDLEVYSSDPRDLSTLDYGAFIEAYRAIIAECVAMLAPDRFAVFVVGDFRDERGFYRNFVSDTIAAFEDAGATLYNEAILVTAVGSLPIRVARQFEGYRKLGKTHQNVLVFYNGDVRAIRGFGPVEVGAIVDDGAPSTLTEE